VRIVLVLLCALLGAATWLVLRNRGEALVIKHRYELFWQALNAGDETVVEALMRPVDQGRGFVNLTWIKDYGGPLDDESEVRVSGAKAWVVPDPIYHFGVLPGGDGVAAVKVDGKWFFTGRISID